MKPKEQCGGKVGSVTFQEKTLHAAREKRSEKLANRCFGALTVALLAFLVFDLIHAVYALYKTRQDAVPASPATWELVNDDGPPSVVLINGERWALLPVDDFVPKDGYKLADTYCEGKTMRYRILSNPRRLNQDDVAHELFHAGACAHGGATWWNSSSDDAHPGIYHLGTFLAQLSHDNPELILWLSK